MKKDDPEYPEADDHEVKEPDPGALDRWSRARLNGGGDFADIEEDDIPW